MFGRSQVEYDDRKTGKRDGNWDSKKYKHVENGKNEPDFAISLILRGSRIVSFKNIRKIIMIPYLSY